MARSPTGHSASSSSSSSAHQWKYDVFLSFRGEDTRKSFTGHLHRELCRKGINTFIDDQLRRGEQISPALLKAIEESRFSIIIFSENYASSSWCLDELTKILDCVKAMGHTAIPVFYKLDPSHVRKQAGSFEEAFARHEEIYRDKPEKVLKWREALTVASNLSGYHLRDRHESEFIADIVTMIFKKLIDASSSDMEDLVGISSRIQDVVELLDIGSHDVRMVGIWGMAGIGKTTIADQVYGKIYPQFDEGHCFLRNVREESERQGLASLQVELLSKVLGSENLNKSDFDHRTNFIRRLRSRKVLIVLDDVNMYEQLEILAGRYDWFGAGSRIIITTKDKALLDRHNINAIYEVHGLETNEAFQLFCWYAFQKNPPTKTYMQLCMKFVDYAKGHPLATKVLGSFLKNKTIDEWRSALDELKGIPNDDIMKVLRISFDGLTNAQKLIFLDIACFFKGHDKGFVEDILKACSFSPAFNIKILENKSLIIVLENKLHMHDLLQEMGREIVQQENVTCPGKRSRLWFQDDVIHVLKSNTGTEAVEGMVLDLSASKELSFSADAFTEMKGLRVLRFYNVIADGSLEYLSEKELRDAPYGVRRWMDDGMQTDCKMQQFEDFKFPTGNLRSFYWQGYPLKSLPSNFNATMLVELNMCFSRLEQLWDGNKNLEKLKFIKLSHSQSLTTTPDFSRAGNVERIILKGCANLVKVHPSIGALQKLIYLNLEGCKNLRYFGISIHMNSLQILTLSGCSKLEKFPEVGENMKSLRELLLDETALRELPSSIGCLNGLVLLNLTNCKRLTILPQSLCRLTSLQILTLSGCSALGKLPDELDGLQGLVELNLDRSSIQEVPPSITHLINLQALSLAGCKIWNVGFSLRSSRTGCLHLGFLWGLSSLKTLTLRDCNISEGALPSDLSSLCSLESLDLSGNNFITLPATLGALPRLTELLLMHCKNLKSVRVLPSSIEAVYADDCSSLEAFSFPSSACQSKTAGRVNFVLSGCYRLVQSLHSDTVGAILEGIRHAASIPKFMDEYGEAFPRVGFHVFVPGSSIPEWFNHQNVGSSVTLVLPPQWYNPRLMGLAVCAVCKAPPLYLPREFVIHLCGSGGEITCKSSRYETNSVKGDVMWFGYIPICELESEDALELTCCRFERPLWLLSDTVEVMFTCEVMSPYGYYPSICTCASVERCGVRLVYEQGYEDGECSFPYDTMIPRLVN